MEFLWVFYIGTSAIAFIGTCLIAYDERKFSWKILFLFVFSLVPFISTLIYCIYTGTFLCRVMNPPDEDEDRETKYHFIFDGEKYEVKESELFFS